MSPTGWVRRATDITRREFGALAAGITRRTVKNTYIPRNVASSTELPSVPKTSIQPLNFEQVNALLDAVEGHRWAALYRLAVNLGMREAELFGLT